MINTLLYRILLAIPTMLGVAVICFMLVQIAPGDPLVSVMPPDASEALRQTLMQAYGFDKPLPLQFIHWLWRALHGDLGMSVATGRPVIDEVMTAVAYSLRLALLATAIGFVLGSLFGFVAGYFRNSVIDRLASVLSVFGVSVPHYWLGMLLVIPLQRQVRAAAGHRRRADRRGGLAMGLGAPAVHAAAGPSPCR
ncbi:ABC transporter permease [Klebsiella pneumoniae subsp. pneumoniae]|nr:ABC transporter permease [Klebsiella pneumoniae subsp. pneumoniae]